MSDSKSSAIDALTTCIECAGYGYHKKSCSRYVDLAREENIRAIREDIEVDLDREPFWINDSLGG